MSDANVATEDGRSEESSAETLSTLAQSASLIMFGTILGRGIGLLSEVLIVRSISQQLYGQVSLAYTIVSVTGTLILLGVHEGVTRQMSSVDSPFERARYLRAGFAIGLAVGLGSVLAMVFSRDLIAGFMGVEALSTFLVFFTPYLLFFPLSKIAFGTLRVQNQSLAAVLAQDIGPKVLATATLLGCVFVGVNVSGVIAYWLLLPMTTFVVATYFLFGKLPLSAFLSRYPDAETMARIWSFSWPLAIGSGVILFLANMDILMVGYFLTETDVAHYRSVQPLKQVATFAHSSFTFLFLPLATNYYVDGEIGELDRLYSVSTKWILLVTVPPVLVFTVFSPDVVTTFFGRKYLAAAPVLSILVGGLLFRAITGLDGDVAKAIDRPKIELYSAVGGLLVNFACNLALIPTVGIVGAAIATVVGYVVYNCIEVVWIYRLTGAHPFSRNTTTFLLSMAAVAVVARLVISVDLGLIGLFAVGGLFIAVEPLVLVATKSVDRADIDLVEKAERRIGRDLSAVVRVLERGL